MVTWEEPPGRNQRPKEGSYAKEAEEFKANPGKWGVLVSFPYSRRSTAVGMASSINQGKYMAFRPKGSFEAVSRTQDGQTKVYVRYIGEGNEQEEELHSGTVRSSGYRRGSSMRSLAYGHTAS